MDTHPFATLEPRWTVSVSGNRVSGSLTSKDDPITSQLRATYEGLSADPNSLANLDQDLPNYLQAVVKIFSLPPQWLWCETWCDDASLATAKTIDLCNNPLTKTPKLENALRIVPEWTTYDQRVHDFEATLKQSPQ